MRTFDCRCGHSIEIVPPCLHAGYLVWDADVDLSIDSRNELIRAFLNAVREGQRARWIADFYGKQSQPSRLGEKDDADIIEDILSREDSWTRHVFRCPLCGRVYVQVERGSDAFRCYEEEAS